MAWTTTIPRCPVALGGVLGADPESTQEFRVITNNFNAEYGRNTGAIIDVVTKSGTNTFQAMPTSSAAGTHSAGRGTGSTGPMTDRRILISATSSDTPSAARSARTRHFSSSTMKWTGFLTTLTGTATVPTAAFKTGVFNLPRLIPTPWAQTRFRSTLRRPVRTNVYGFPLGSRPCRRSLRCIPTRPYSRLTDVSGIFHYPSIRRRPQLQTRGQD